MYQNCMALDDQRAIYALHDAWGNVNICMKSTAVQAIENRTWFDGATKQYIQWLQLRLMLQCDVRLQPSHRMAWKCLEHLNTMLRYNIWDDYSFLFVCCNVRRGNKSNTWHWHKPKHGNLHNDYFCANIYFIILPHWRCNDLSTITSPYSFILHVLGVQFNLIPL